MASMADARSKTVRVGDLFPDGPMKPVPKRVEKMFLTSFGMPLIESDLERDVAARFKAAFQVEGYRQAVWPDKSRIDILFFETTKTSSLRLIAELTRPNPKELLPREKNCEQLKAYFLDQLRTDPSLTELRTISFDGYSMFFGVIRRETLSSFDYIFCDVDLTLYSR